MLPIGLLILIGLLMITINMQYFSSMSSGSFVLDHTRLDKGGGSTEGEQCTSTRHMHQVTECSFL